MKTKSVLNVHQCSACGGEHPNFEFALLPKEELVNGHMYRFAAPCPTTGVTIYANEVWTESGQTRHDQAMYNKVRQK